MDETRRVVAPLLYFGEQDRAAMIDPVGDCIADASVRGVGAQARANTSETFCPPKPNELLSADDPDRGRRHELPRSQKDRFLSCGRVTLPNAVETVPASDPPRTSLRGITPIA
jgi:hypothetical protein